MTKEPERPKVIDLLQALEDSILEARAERIARQDVEGRPITMFNDEGSIG